MPPDHPPADLDEALARVDARSRAATEAVEGARAFAEAMEQLRGRGQASGVRVVVNWIGLPVSVTYDELAARLGAQALSTATMAAVRAALGDALAQVTVKARETWAGDPLADQVVAEVTQRFAVVTR